MLSGGSGGKATKKKTLQPLWVLFIRRQSNKSLGHSVLCVHLEGWDGEGWRETQEGGEMGIYVYV